MINQPRFDIIIEWSNRREEMWNMIHARYKDKVKTMYGIDLEAEFFHEMYEYGCYK